MTTAHSLLAFANVQMAVEALFGLQASSRGNSFSGTLESPSGQSMLTAGNDRSSKFTSVQAAEFAQIWEVVEHKSNSATGLHLVQSQVRCSG